MVRHHGAAPGGAASPAVRLTITGTTVGALLAAAEQSPTGTDYSGPIVVALIGAISVVLVALIPVVGNLIRKPAAPGAPTPSTGPSTGEQLAAVRSAQAEQGRTHRRDHEETQRLTREHREWVDQQLRDVRAKIGDVQDDLQHHLWGDHGQPRT